MLRDLHGTASRTVSASPAESFGLLTAVERYPDWYPEAIREVDVLDRDADGQPRRARTQLHLSWGPVVKDFDLVLAVEVEPSTIVRLVRVSDRPSVNTFDVTWRVRAAGATHIDLDLRATLDLPRFLPLGGIGNAIAGGFVNAAARQLAPTTGAR